MNFSPFKNRSPSVNPKKHNPRAKYITYFKTLEDDSRAFYTADKWQETVKTSSQPSSKLPIERSHENAIMAGMTKGPEVWRNHSSFTVPTVESTEGSPDVNQYLHDLKEGGKGTVFFNPKRKFLDEGIHRAMYKLKKGKEEIENQVKNLSRFEVNLMENKLPVTQKDIGAGLLRKDRMNKAKRLFLFREAVKQNPPVPTSKDTVNINIKGSSVLNPPSVKHRIQHSMSTFDDSLTRPPTTASFYHEVNRKIVMTAGSDLSETDHVLGLQTTAGDTIDSEIFDEKYKTGTYFGLANNMSFTSEKKAHALRGYNNLSTPERNSRHQRNNMRLTTGGLHPSKLIRKDASSFDSQKRPAVIHSGLERQKILSGKNVISQPATSNRAMCYGKLHEWFESLKVNGKNNHPPGFKTAYGSIGLSDQKSRVNSKRDADEESCLSFDRSSVTEGNEISKREFKSWKNQEKASDMQTPKLSITWDLGGNESLKTDVTSRGPKYAFKYGKMIDLELQSRKKMFSQRFNRKKDPPIALRTEQSPTDTDIGGWSMSHTMDPLRKESLF